MGTAELRHPSKQYVRVPVHQWLELRYRDKPLRAQPESIHNRGFANIIAREAPILLDGYKIAVELLRLQVSFSNLVQFGAQAMAQRAFRTQLIEQCLSLGKRIARHVAFEQLPPTARNFLLG